VRGLSSLRDRRTRLAAYAAVVVVLALALSFQAATAGSVSAGTASDERWTEPSPTATTEPAAEGTSPATETSAPSATSAETTVGDGEVGTDRNRSGVLVTVQSYGGFGQNNGRAVIVENGEEVWSFAPEDSRVFDAELLDNGNVLVSYATKLPASACPERTLEYRPEECVRNNVVELDYDTKEPVFEYRWYDAFVTHHEVHDADRLPSGETVVIDMGDDRTFVVAENESIVWEWSAREHLGEGSSFREQYGGPEREGPESDWTHMNDVDRTDDGDFLLSIRNFDVVIEVNRSTKAVDHVTGLPRDGGEDVEGREPVLDEQHNPTLVGDESALLVADSEADRVVEIDRSTGEVVWTYDEDLVWPRDADRLPNGNTLVTNSLGYEVVEVTPDGEVTWSYQVRQEGKRGIPYEADRVSLPEEPSSMPSIRELRADDGEGSGDGTARPTATDGGEAGDGGGSLDRYRGFALLYLPWWVGSFELWLLVGIVLVALVALGDGVAYAVGRARHELSD